MQGVGGETSADNAFYPHGLVYDTSAIVAAGSTSYTVNNRTISSAKTPDMRSRTTIGAGDAHGTYDGFTSGQVGGQEDADTLYTTDSGNAVYVYSAASATSANLRDPFVATHYIVRTSSHAPAALVGDITLNNSDDDLTDHSTAIKEEGDVLVWDGTSNYKNLKLFNSYPDSGFEGNFIIDTEKAMIGIGDDAPNAELHIKKASSSSEGTGTDNINGPGIRIQDTGGAILDIYADNNYGQIGTVTDDAFKLRTKDGARITINASGESYRTDFHKSVDMQENLGVTGSVTVGNSTTSANLQVTGQVYSNSATLVHDTIPNMDNGNVHIADINSGTSFTLKNPSGEVAGGMYSLVLDNVGNGNNVTLTIGDQYKFANGIQPNIVRAGKILVISAICMSTDLLLCTWAEDFS